jgi:hypothetical protein
MDKSHDKKYENLIKNWFQNIFLIIGQNKSTLMSIKLNFKSIMEFYSKNLSDKNILDLFTAIS